jgi:RNA polymerase sigma-70 factor (ECF subfamily)
LWRITRNAFLDEVRKRRRRPSLPFPDDSDQVLASFSSPAPDEVLADLRLDDDIQKALSDLPYEFREAVVMCDVIGLSYEEISIAVAIPVGTVRSRIHRGRRLLRERLT